MTPLTDSAQRLRAGGTAYAWDPQIGAFLGVKQRDGSGQIDW